MRQTRHMKGNNIAQRIGIDGAIIININGQRERIEQPTKEFRMSMGL